MALQRLYFVTVLIFVGAVQASPKPNDEQNIHENCKPQLPSFNEAQAVGTWQPSLNKSDTDEPVGAECVRLTSVGDQERRDLKDMIGIYVDKIKWENLTMRMQLPCATETNNNTNDVYLERLDGDGSYKMLSIPQPLKLEFGAFARIPIRFKLVDNEQLGIMSCHTYLFSKQADVNTTANEHILDTIQSYWPEVI